MSDYTQGTGGDPEVFPDNVGLPLAEEFGGATYFILETHYDNPSMQQDVVDNSGLRFLYTDIVREHDTGMFLIGVDPYVWHTIPPYQDSFMSLGRCPSECTNEVI